MSGIQQAKVKSVLSGDTLVLSAINNPRNERTLSLAYVSAPRMRREGDEAFAVESRDYIRRLLVGKVIQFKVVYKLPTGTQRDYGIVTLINGQQLPEASVADGYLKVREDAGRREESDEATSVIEKLRMLEAKARSDGKGVWDTEAPKIRTAYELDNAQQFTQEWKGKPIDAVVEKVLTGDRLIVRLIRSSTEHVQSMLLIAGIRAPNTKRINTSDNKELPAEPLGDEAHEFVEARLLQRKVQVYIVGLSPQNQLIGTALHPMGDIAIFVLEAGLARCVDQHSTLLGQNMSKLRQAEKKARDSRKGLFKDTTGPRSTAGPGADAVVSRVQTADTLFVRLPNGAEKRINLSSVRQPKPSDPKQSPFGADAKEYMRKRLIGKHVKVSVDGKRAATEGFDEREMATVVQNGKNVALALVEAGYASVLRHKYDDPDRSPIYDDLLAAEATAQQEQKGMWSPKPPEAKAYVDYSETLEKAKRLLTLLSRQKRVPAIVDFVKSGSRFALLIPRENAKLTLVLSGINCPKSARNPNESSEPFGKEAHDLAARRCQQRDVEIDVEDTDKNGGFIGKLYVGRENFAKILLEDGFASVRLYSAEKSGNANELLAAEQKAKDTRKGQWKDWDPSQETNGDAEAGVDEIPATTNGESEATSAPSKDYRDIIVTNIDESCRLKLQHISPSTTGALSSLMQAFRQFHLSPQNATPLSGAPKAGDFVAAKFSQDEQWYRARVRRNDRENQSAEVMYVDYGNSETKPWKELRPLGKPEYGTQALRGQALDAALSFVQFPSGSQSYMQDARNWLEDRLGAGDQLVARVDYADQRDNTLFVTIFDPAKDEGAPVETSSVNAEAVEGGFAMVARKPTRWEKSQGKSLGVLKEVETRAREAREGMWEYGDPTGEDE